jgi:hypothetical protein
MLRRLSWESNWSCIQNFADLRIENRTAIEKDLLNGIFQFFCEPRSFFDVLDIAVLALDDLAQAIKKVPFRFFPAITEKEVREQKGSDAGYRVIIDTARIPEMGLDDEPEASRKELFPHELFQTPGYPVIPQFIYAGFRGFETLPLLCRKIVFRFFAEEFHATYPHVKDRYRHP